MANTWFRMYAEFATDPKVQMMSEADQRRFIMLLCMRCSNGDVTLQDEEIAFQLRISNEEWQRSKALFVSKNLIDIDNNITAWDKRQFVSDSSAERVARHRAKKKQGCNVTVTPPDTDTDTEESISVTNVTSGETAAQSPRDSATREPENSDPLVLFPVAHSMACPVERLVGLYHELMPRNPRCRVLNQARRKSIAARWKEAAGLDTFPFKGGYDTQAKGLACWREFFAICADSDFLTGRCQPAPGRPPFVADLDFLMSPSAFAKTLENKYHREAAA